MVPPQLSVLRSLSDYPHLASFLVRACCVLQMNSLLFTGVAVKYTVRCRDCQIELSRLLSVYVKYTTERLLPEYDRHESRYRRPSFLPYSQRFFNGEVSDTSLSTYPPKIAPCKA